MKNYLSLAAFVLFVSTGGLSHGFDLSHPQLTEILKTYVNDQGMVDYQSLEKNRSGLDSYLKTTGAITEKQFNAWSKADQIAFLINVYNAETLQLIIDHYPVKSIKKIGGLLSSPWEIESVTLFGSPSTLDHVEHGILRTKYDEPRIHFALVCAAVSCPPLRREAYVGAKLDQQLDDQARIFLNDKSKNRVEGTTLYLSRIFDWFEEDFTKDDKSLFEYVRPYLDFRAKTLKFTKYDWSLNAQ